MEWVIGFVKQLYAAAITFPLLSFVVLWLGFYAIYLNKRKAMLLTIDVTCLLLFGAVAEKLISVFSFSFAYYFLLIVSLLLFGWFGNLQYRKRGKVNSKKIISVMLRLGFFVLLGCDLVLGAIQWFL
ncbi:DUF3397 family protein [Paenibacillus sp. y28]|uniref:DUF3397 family protein n=1 Tax=Paenibacillus sp. y28 TaxID=3129110 RepID=UPI003018E635